MSSIIIMNSKEFLKKFAPNYPMKQFQFLLISEDIKNNGDYKNVFAVRALIPPPHIVSHFVNDGWSKTYKEKYNNYLSMPKIESFLTIMVKLVTVDKVNVVLLCSENEMQYRYMELISEYLKVVYGVKPVSFKKFMKKPKECNSVPNKKKTMSILKKKLPKVKIEESAETVNNKTVKKHLKKMSEKKLRLVCMERGIKIKNTDEKNDIIKKIMNNIQ